MTRAKVTLVSNRLVSSRPNQTTIQWRCIVGAGLSQVNLDAVGPYGTRPVEKGCGVRHESRVRVLTGWLGKWRRGRIEKSSSSLEIEFQLPMSVTEVVAALIQHGRTEKRGQPCTVNVECRGQSAPSGTQSSTTSNISTSATFLSGLILMKGSSNERAPFVVALH